MAQHNSKTKEVVQKQLERTQSQDEASLLAPWKDSNLRTLSKHLALARLRVFYVECKRHVHDNIGYVWYTGCFSMLKFQFSRVKSHYIINSYHIYAACMMYGTEHVRWLYYSTGQSINCAVIVMESGHRHTLVLSPFVIIILLYDE